MNPYSTSRNKYTENRKDNTIETPIKVAEFLYEEFGKRIEKAYHKKKLQVLDPAVGNGNLLFPFSNQPKWDCLGIDINSDRNIPFPIDYAESDYLSWTEIDWKYHFNGNRPNLVIINPPFNNDKYGRKLLPELFLDQTWCLFGFNLPVICIVPMGYRLNQRMRSKRWRKLRDHYPDLASIVSLPLDIFSGVEFHCEVVIYNIAKVKPHYFLPEYCIEGEHYARDEQKGLGGKA